MNPFLHFKQYEFIPTCLYSYVSKSMNSYHLTLWSFINSEHCVFWPEFWCFLLNFSDASGEHKPLVLWFYIRVKYQRLRGENGTKEGNLCEEAADGRLRQMIDWWCGKCACGHCKKNREIQSLSGYTECCTKMCDSLNLNNHGALLRKSHAKKSKV